MIEFLISALILLVVLYVLKMIIDALGLPDNIKQIAYLILGVIVLVWVLGQFGIGGGGRLLN